jgi:hypothetical protein
VDSEDRWTDDRLTLVVACFVTAICALVATIGADADWLAALGRSIADGWSIPGGVPFAAVSSQGWHNVPVLGELVFHALEAGLGTRGLVLAQLVAVAACLSLVSVDMRRAGAADAPSAFVLFLVAVAAAPTLLVVRSQLFSLALFPALLVLLRRESRAPSRRIWLLLPLTALWSNLHGGVLLGVLVAGCYLVFRRLRAEPFVSTCVLLGTVAALFATPALLHTASYYRGVMGSEAALSGQGLWRPLSLGAPFDVVFLVVAVPLLFVAVRSRPRAWEIVAALGLAYSAGHASRNEVWFVLFLAAPAARGLAGSRPWAEMVPRRAATVLVVALVSVAALGLSRSPATTGASSRLVDAAGRAAGGSPILADGDNAELLALAGDRILIGNPLDAFPRVEQRRYLDWLAGRPAGDVESSRVRVVLVRRGSVPARRLAQRAEFRVAARDRNAILFVRAG